MTRFNSSGERGAVLIHVAVAMLGLLAFSSLVIDYGVFWVARGQAQNAADAGALAGAMGLAYDDPLDRTDTGPAKLAARAAARANLVFGSLPDVNITTDVTFPPCPDDNSDVCVKVDVYRTAARGNPLPTFFSRLVGIGSQDMRATATAKVLSGNATKCMRPFAIMDKWDEWNEKDTANEHDYYLKEDKIDDDYDPLVSSYDMFPPNGNHPPQENDLYVPHTSCDPGGSGVGCSVGTGYRLFNDDGTPLDYGTYVFIKGGSQSQTSAGWFQPVRLYDGASGASDYCESIKGCTGEVNVIGQTLETEQGNMVGKTRQCLWTDSDSLYNKDPTARWDDDAGGIVSDKFPGLNTSPRIIPLPVMSPLEYFQSDPSGQSSVTIHNILGFFIEGSMDKNGNKVNGAGGGGHDITYGRLVTVPGFYAGGDVVDPSVSFIKQIVLIR